MRIWQPIEWKKSVTKYMIQNGLIFLFTFKNWALLLSSVHKDYSVLMEWKSFIVHWKHSEKYDKYQFILACITFLAAYQCILFLGLSIIRFVLYHI